MRTRAQSTVLFALLTPALLLLGLAWLVTPAGPAAAKRLPKVDVCHIPPGNPGNAHTINVSENALEAHLAHGDFAVGEACSEGTGECRAEGTTQCDAADTCSAVPSEPSDEICDGRDNDCDGAVDNPPILGLGECTAGVGECANDGFEICNNGIIECDAIPNTPLEDPEVTCDDGRDNDCDGLIDTQDDDCPVLCCDPTPRFIPFCSEGVTCCGDGTWRCNQADGSDSCVGPLGDACEPAPLCPCVDTWENGDDTGARPLSQSALTECTEVNQPSRLLQLAGSDVSLHQYIARVESRSSRENDVICSDDILGDLDIDRSAHSFDTEIEAATALEACRPVLNDAGCDL